MTIVSSVPTELVENVWAAGASRWIAAALRREQPPRYALQDVLGALLAEKSALWIAVDPDNRDDPIEAAMITEVFEYPQLKEYRVPWIGGRNLWRWAREFDRLTDDAARAHDCRIKTGAYRLGWKRFGYSEQGCILVKEL